MPGKRDLRPVCPWGTVLVRATNVALLLHLAASALAAYVEASRARVLVPRETLGLRSLYQRMSAMPAWTCQEGPAHQEFSSVVAFFLFRSRIHLEFVLT